MEQIGFIIGETFLYWSSIILALAAVAAILVFLGLYIAKGGSPVAGFLAVPASAVTGVYLARLIHWYCQADAYESMEKAMTDFSSGGYALMGVFFACVIVACVLRLVRLSKNLPQMLDCMALAGAAGVAAGRFSVLFNSSNRGQVLESVTWFPVAQATVDSVTGQTEYRLATFALQGILAGILFVGLTAFYLVKRKKGALKHGDTCLLFLLVYGASQAVLDSCRYDSLFFRSNGFVSIVQILGCVSIVLAVVIFSVRMVMARKWKWWYLALWVPIAGALGGAGYMEYHVQRHGDQALFAYTVMSLCLLAVVVITVVIRALAVTAEAKPARPELPEEN